MWIFPGISVVDLRFRTDFDVDPLVLQVEIHFIGDEDGIHDDIPTPKEAMSNMFPAASMQTESTC